MSDNKVYKGVFPRVISIIACVSIFITILIDVQEFYELLNRVFIYLTPLISMILCIIYYFIKHKKKKNTLIGIASIFMVIHYALFTWISARGLIMSYRWESSFPTYFSSSLIGWILNLSTHIALSILFVLITISLFAKAKMVVTVFSVIAMTIFYIMFSIVIPIYYDSFNFNILVIFISFINLLPFVPFLVQPIFYRKCETKQIAEATLTPLPYIESSSADELRKFKQLLDDGIIGCEEFEAKKQQLLNS